MKSTKHSTAGVPVIAFRNGALSFLSPPSLNTPAVFFLVNYRQYIQSDQWRTRRKAYLQPRTRLKCKICFCYGPFDLHHKTYRNLGNEKDNELLALCRGCHDLIHELATFGAGEIPKLPNPLKNARRAWLKEANRKNLWHLRLSNPQKYRALANDFIRGRAIPNLMKPKPVAEPCRCGCGLTVAVCEALFRVGVPSEGLTRGQAGLIMSRLAKNDWRLPEAFAFLKNEGEWFERRFKGKPAKK